MGASSTALPWSTEWVKVQRELLANKPKKIAEVEEDTKEKFDAYFYNIPENSKHPLEQRIWSWKHWVRNALRQEKESEKEVEKLIEMTDNAQNWEEYSYKDLRRNHYLEYRWRDEFNNNEWVPWFEDLTDEAEYAKDNWNCTDLHWQVYLTPSKRRKAEKIKQDLPKAVYLGK